MKRQISILGCGWLGLPLAEALVQDGFSVLGSTTSPEKLGLLAQKGIVPFLLEQENAEITPENAAFFQSEILVINVPPKRNAGNSYAAGIGNLTRLLAKFGIRKVLFVSSTGVYEPSFQEITEESPLAESEAQELIAAEKLLAAGNHPWKTTILRLAGLFGPNREPGRFLAGKTGLPDREAPVNLIHLEDCIGIMQEIIRQEKWGEIFNACADEHPSRREFYTAAAHKLQLPEPTFLPPASEAKPGKLISNRKLKNALNYQFRYPDPLKAIGLNK